MSITLFARRDFKGDDITGFDLKDFSHIAHPMRPTSIRMTSTSDRILLFTRPNWQGSAMFLSGEQSIEHLGHPGDGGDIGFGNTISSMRVTPFRLKLRFHVITNEPGDLPGNIASRALLDATIANIVSSANAIWSPNLISIEHESTVIVNDLPQYFDIPHGYWTTVTRHRRFDRLPAGANIVLVNSINDRSEGKAISHLLTDMIAFEATGSGVVLAHELGHFFGLVHRNGKEGNLMQHNISDVALTQREIEEAHENFARFSGLANSPRTE
jgi:hypothetical protein